MTQLMLCLLEIKPEAEARKRDQILISDFCS
jgi:hypothetical protein